MNKELIKLTEKQQLFEDSAKEQSDGFDFLKKRVHDVEDRLKGTGECSLG